MSLGVTSIVKVAELEFPARSSAVHVTVVVPTGNTRPDAGRQLDEIKPLPVSTTVGAE